MIATPAHTQSLGPPHWRLGSQVTLCLMVGLTVGFAAMRALGTLGPAYMRALVPLAFTAMAILPWILMTRVGRATMGLQRAKSSAYLLPTLAGTLAAWACFLIGWWLYDFGSAHWYVTIALNFRSNVPQDLSPITAFLMFVIPAMLFSPIGEEIFFRGMLQQMLSERIGIAAATWIECGLFGLVHLCHHGLLWQDGDVQWAGSSALLWVALMTLTAYLFAVVRARTGSLLPAMAAHAAFNLNMAIAIFTTIWN